MPIEIKENQTLLDVAIQTAGGVDASFDLALLNGKSITDALQSGEKIETGVPVVNKTVADYYNKNQMLAASNIPAKAGEVVEEGIDFWAIEYEFEVN